MPVPNPPRQRQQAPVPAPPAVEEEITVLHVDDDSQFGTLTAAYLERCDGRFSVRTASSGAAGLDVLAETTVDCVVSDYDMPEMDGIEFLDAVRATDPEVPFILFTANGSESIASDAISAGVSDYLRKGKGTDHFTRLAERIGTLVTGYRTRELLERVFTAIETSRDGTALLDVDGTVQYVNEPYAAIVGSERDALLGEHVSACYTDAQRAEGLPESLLERALADGRVEHRESRVRPDGSTGDVHVVITAVHEDDRTHRGFWAVARTLDDECVYFGTDSK